MAKIKRLVALILSCMLLVTSFNFEAFAASVIPFDGIEYNYSKTVTKGSFRYICQNSPSKNYHKEYWGTWTAEHECMTSSMSMALSYIGINITPKTILDKFNGSTKSNYSWGGATYSLVSFDEAWKNYVNGKGEYAPPIIHLTGGSCGYSRGHYLPVVSKLDTNTYQVLDPWSDNTRNHPLHEVTIKNNKVTYYLGGGKTLFSSSLSSATQYYNKPKEEPAPPKEETLGEEADENAQEQSGFVLKTMEANPETITETSAEVYAKYENPAGFVVTKTGYKYGTNPESLTSEVYFSANITKASGELSKRTISELTPGTTYYFKPLAIAGDMTFYGSVKSFTTLGNAPEQKPEDIPEQNLEQTPEELPEQKPEEQPKEEVTVPQPDKPVISSVSNASTGMTIKWKKVSNASGYYVYRKNSDGEYKKIATVKSKDTVSYNDKDANTSGTSYSYKVYAYKTVDGVTAKSSASAVKTYMRVGAVSDLKLTSPSKKKLKITYKKVSKATSYEIVYSAYSDYYNSLTVENKSNSKTLSTRKSKVKYYVKVRAKIKKGSSTYYGPWSSKNIKVK